MTDNCVNAYLQKFGYTEFTPKTVLFDMDGTVYDSMHNHAVCWQKAMAEYGIDMPYADTYKYEGMRGVETIQIVVKQQQGRDITEAEAQEMYDEKARLFGLLPKSPVMPGTFELMRKIKAAGMQVGIVTGSGQRPLIARLEEDFHEFLDRAHIVCAYDVSHGKPAPDPYLMGLEKAGCQHPWEGIVVENAPLGVRSGAAAGMFTIAINSGPLPDNVLAEAGADIVVPNMQTLSEDWEKIIGLQ